MRLFLLGAILFALDQLSKAWVRLNFLPGESRPVIEGVFHLTYVQNRGVAFGLLQGQIPLIIALTVVLAAVAFWYRDELREAPKAMKIAYTLTGAGALGNFVDRIGRGWVTDFLDLRVWPVFNVADTAIVAGVILVMWFGVLRSPKTKEA